MRIANSSTTITGTAWSTVQFIHIDFYWLIYPLFIYVLITTFLFSTIVLTRKRRLPTWKQSALALLRASDPQNEAYSKDEMKEAARRSMLRFVPRGETWKLEESGGR